ncbi:hypothetical protein MMC30_004519 [Trapelia coarctata]|nr:hypothetical protein [Trapelia coarctata]
MDQINPKNGLCLLSLDGGGVRGLSALLILKRIMYVLDGIEEPTVKRPLLPCNYFDMIAGTSTGGLIAIMLGVLRMDVDTCISKYLEMAPQIFPTEGFVSGSKMGKLWKGIKGEARFDAGKLESYVKNLVKDHLKLVNQDVLLDFDRNAGSPASCKTFVCVTNKDTGRPFRLRNYRSSWEPSTGCTIWQAARATVAAPLFFPPVRFGHPPENYVDGGLRYNNPVRALYDEAKRVWNKSSEPRIGCVISIGTGVPPLQATGDSGKDILKSLVNIAMDTQQTANEFADEMELVTEPGNFTYIRFNVEQGLQQVGVEEWRQFDKLTGATKDYLNNHKKEVERCAMALHDLVAPSSEGKRSIFLSELPISSRQFFGRAAELGQMRGFLKLTGPETKAVVLWGLGGFGKSRIALRYIELFQREYSAVLWINALSLESALASYSNIAAEIRSRYAASIRTQQMEALEDINLVKRWLGMDENDRWLMIIDSVDDLNTFDCRQLIPACSHGTIIVTSTHSRTAVALGFKGLDIHSIDDESGSEMLLSSLAAELHGEEAIKTAKSIVKTLDDIPLAIEQAAAWLQDVGSIREFLGFYRTQYDSLMKYVPERSSWSYDKNRSIFTTFELLFQKLNMEHKAAADLLTVFSFFGPCTIPARRLFRSPTLDTTSESLSLLRISDAPESTRTKWDKAQWVDQLVSEQLSLRLAINSMEKLCLLKVRKAPSGDIISFSLHNSICRWRVETLNERERQEWAALASYLLCRTLLDPDTDFDLSTSHRVLILYSNNMLKSHIKRDSIEAPDGKLFRPYGFAMACFAPLYLEFGRTAEAEGMFKAAIDYGRVTQDSSWPADVKSLKLIKGQAELYSKMGQREKAAEALGSLLHSSTKLLGDMDQMTIWTAGKLRDIREAKLSYANNEHRALEASAGSKLGTTSSTEHGSNHIRYPVPENVADVPDEEYVFLQVLQQTTDEFGERDEDTRKAVQQLAIYYRSQRRFLEAQKLLERLWEEDQVGGFHKAKSETLHYVVDLVECYKATGSLENALKPPFVPPYFGLLD